jgi:hypothetical protein
VPLQWAEQQAWGVAVDHRYKGQFRLMAL